MTVDEILARYSEGAFRFKYSFNPRYDHKWYDGLDAHQFIATCAGISIRLTARMALIERDDPLALSQASMKTGFGALYDLLTDEYAGDIARNNARGTEKRPLSTIEEPVKGGSVEKLYR
jgi:hypothetical protein